MLRQLYVLSMVLILTACVFWTAPTGRISAPSPTPVCPTSKISFTQAEGCQNDGSVEFCIPANDPATLESVQYIAPGVVCMRAGGRAHCNLDDEIVCLLPIDGLCADIHGAMTDEGWQTVCALAELSIVREIVPTWYE